MSEKLTTKADRRSSESSDGSATCVVCFKTVNVYSIGCCDHPVCYECSTRMRILCKQNECPICRQDMPKVVFTPIIASYSHLLFSHSLPHTLTDRRFGILFASPAVQRAYYQLLEHRCYVCANNNERQQRIWPLKTFQGLKDHMRREHELFYCDLCVDNLKIFTFERRVYTRAELGLHRRKGDKDDTSHRGHPLCEFCDTRYMDSDELFRHLRRDHLFCHFCDADGKHQFYSNYNDLCSHFKNEHFLCEEGDCRNEQFTSAFRTDIDLKAHIASTHSKGMSRQANKINRTLELEFTLAPRPRQDMVQVRDNRQQRTRLNVNQQRNNVMLTANTVDQTNEQQYNTEPGGFAGGGAGNSESYRIGDFEYNKEAVMQRPLSIGDFPSLGGSNSSAQGDLPMGGSNRVTFTSRVVPDFSVADFPTLDGRVSTPPPKVMIKKQKEEYPSLNSGKKWTPEVTISQEYVDAGKMDNIRRTNVKVSYKNPQDQPSSSRNANFSIELNHKKAPTANSSNTNKPSSKQLNSVCNVTKSNIQAPITSAVVKVRPPRPSSMTDAFPALGTSGLATEPSQWVQAKTKKKDEPKATKVAPAPVLPPSNGLADFPSLSKVVKGKKSSSVTMPVSNNWVNLNDINKNTPQPKTQTKNQDDQEVEQETQQTNTNDTSKNKSKKKNKQQNKSPIEICESNNDVKKVTSEKNHNNLVKKRSEIRIDSLQIQDGRPQEELTSSTLRAPPGFNSRHQNLTTSKPPPGFNHVNDFTFTSSSGQSYPILPTTSFVNNSTCYRQPPNFQHRNKHLIETLLKILKSSDDSGDTVKEFKNYSELFRKGGYPAHKYYEHCQLVLDDEFDRIFPELLALLPDVTKQRELYRVHLEKSAKGSKLLDLCAICGQIILKGIDFKSHVTSHSFEQNFGANKSSTNVNSTVAPSTVWKK